MANCYFYHRFLYPRTECIMLYGAVRKFYPYLHWRLQDPEGKGSANIEMLPLLPFKSVEKFLAIEEDNFGVHYWKGTYSGKWTP